MSINSKLILLLLLLFLLLLPLLLPLLLLLFVVVIISSKMHNERGIGRSLSLAHPREILLAIANSRSLLFPICSLARLLACSLVRAYSLTLAQSLLPQPPPPTQPTTTTEIYHSSFSRHHCFSLCKFQAAKSLYALLTNRSCCCRRRRCCCSCCSRSKNQFFFQETQNFYPSKHIS